MYQYCLWYKISSQHNLNNSIKSYSNDLQTPVFPAHITINKNLSLKDAETLFDTYKTYKKPTFISYGLPTTEKTIIDNVYFFSIEQTFSIDDVKIPHLHASLAYRINVPFLATEVKPYEHFIIRPSDITLCIANCSSRNIHEWSIYREHKH